MSTDIYLYFEKSRYKIDLIYDTLISYFIGTCHSTETMLVKDYSNYNIL